MTTRAKQVGTKTEPLDSDEVSVVERVLITANEYIVGQYPIGLLGGPPRLIDKSKKRWVVPIILTSPGYGAVGEVGLVTVEEATGEVAESTPRSEVVAAAKKLRESKGDELEAAFRRARTA